MVERQYFYCLNAISAHYYNWPESVPPQKDNRFPNDEAIEELDGIAREHVRRLLDGGLCERLAKCSDFLTVGVDSKKPKISSTDNRITENHVEFVYVVNLETGDMRFTGKSYPTLACPTRPRTKRLILNPTLKKKVWGFPWLGWW